MKLTSNQINEIIASFHTPDRSRYPEQEDADVLYEELVRYEHKHNIDPFDVEICLEQIEWGRTNHPRKSLFVLTAHKL